MLYRTDIGGTRPLVQVDAPTFVTPVGDARQESFERFAHIQLGKQMMAEILSRFDDGTFLVKIADTAARMNLPEGTKIGDSIPLSLISHEPRPTFLLGQQSSGAVATLSTTARWISNLLQAVQQEGAPASLVGKAALIPSPAGMQPAPLAGTLQDTLTYSGLFYESHVVQWAQGERSHAELMREPQARFARVPIAPQALILKAAEQQFVASPDVPGAVPNATPGANAASAIAIANAATQGEPSYLQIDPQTGVLVKVVAATAQEGEKQEMPVLSKAASHLVSLQLDTLDSNRVVWRGDLWPGQPFEWEVSEDTPRNQVEDVEKTWRSVLRLALPTLGSIHATVQLAGDDVQLFVRAESEDVAAALRAHGDELAAALKATGTRLGFMGVSLDGAA